MKFVRKYGFAKGIIRMFDYWVDTILPRQLKARKLELPGVGFVEITSQSTGM